MSDNLSNESKSKERRVIIESESEDEDEMPELLSKVKGNWEILLGKEYGLEENKIKEKERKEMHAKIQRKKIVAERAEERKERLEDMAKRSRQAREAETAEERKERLEDMAARSRQAREAETAEKRKERLQDDAGRRKKERDARYAAAMEALCADDFNISAEDLKAKMALFEKLQQTDPRLKDLDFFSDSNQSLVKALLLFYMNSGCFRFDQCKECGDKWNEEPLDMECLRKELQEEGLNGLEASRIMKQFLASHSYTQFKLNSCGACGIRDVSSNIEGTLFDENNDNRNAVQGNYKKFELSKDGPLSVLCYTNEQIMQLKEMKNNSFHNNFAIPVNNKWEKKEICTWKLWSFFEQPEVNGESTCWHLHPELVDEDGSHWTTMLCVHCTAAVEKGKIPNNSIAKGVDFGHYLRLGLTNPNLQEQLILARTRLYYTALKVASNKSGSSKEFDARRMARLHAIIFPHNAPEVSTHLWNTEILRSMVC